MEICAFFPWIDFSCKSSWIWYGETWSFGFRMHLTELNLINRPVPSTSFEVTSQTDLCLEPVSRLFPNKSISPGYKPAHYTLLANNHQSRGKQKFMVWPPTTAYYSKGPIRCVPVYISSSCLYKYLPKTGLGSPSDSHLSETVVLPKLMLE